MATIAADGLDLPEHDSISIDRLMGSGIGYHTHVARPDLCDGTLGGLYTVIHGEVPRPPPRTRPAQCSPFRRTKGIPARSTGCGPRWRPIPMEINLSSDDTIVSRDAALAADPRIRIGFNTARFGRRHDFRSRRLGNDERTASKSSRTSPATCWAWTCSRTRTPCSTSPVAACVPAPPAPPVPLRSARFGDVGTMNAGAAVAEPGASP